MASRAMPRSTIFDVILQCQGVVRLSSLGFHTRGAHGGPHRISSESVPEVILATHSKLPKFGPLVGWDEASGESN